MERAELAERTREEEARARVDEERLRIAREVHDTVAHAIAIINVQAGVTAYVLDKRPERAREALLTIEQTSSQALHEMRAILGVLRDADDGRVPHPGLGQIDELAAKAREAGLDVELEVSRRRRRCRARWSSAAYRILQESITNVIRHVGPTRVTVALDYGPDALEVRVTDDGAAADPAPADATRTAAGPRDRRDARALPAAGRGADAGPRPGGGLRGHGPAAAGAGRGGAR